MVVVKREFAVLCAREGERDKGKRKGGGGGGGIYIGVGSWNYILREENDIS